MIEIIKWWTALSLAFFFPTVPQFLIFEIQTVEPSINNIRRLEEEIPTLDINKLEIIEQKRRIAFTHYYVGDSMASANITSTGHTSADFTLNSEGWYTYQGKVVLAAATQICLNVKSGACGRYNSVPNGVKVYKLYDTITFQVNNKEYKGIILDSCGACMTLHSSDDYVQRYDIFIGGSKFRFNKMLGFKITKEIYDGNLHTQ